MERNEISAHEIKVYLALKSNPDKWLSNAEIAALAAGVSPRTVRAHTLRLVSLGILDQAEVFPAHRYRFSAKGNKRNAAYTIRLTQAAEIMGLT
jgi:DNA-binding transcriptional regulator PaaX